MELGQYKINVNGLCPGIIKTDFAKALWENPEILKDVESYAPLQRIGTTDEVAGFAILLASKPEFHNRTSYYYGWWYYYSWKRINCIKELFYF